MAEQWTVGEHGELVIGEAQRRRWGLVPGGRVIATETPHGLLLRPADPPLTKVYVEPTSHCNLHCRTCMRHSWEEPGGTMAMGTFQRLIEGLRDVSSLRKVSFWGFGEPLLHPDIVAMVSLAKGLGAQAEIITNGLLLDAAKAEALVWAGLDSIVFSIDGTSAETQADARAGADLGLLRENASALRRARAESPRHNPEIGIEFVATKRNVHELPALRYLALEMGASFIIVTNVLPYTRELAGQTLYDLAVGSLKARQRNKWQPQIVLPVMDTRWEAALPISRLVEQLDGDDGLLRRAGENGAYCKFVGEGSLAVGWDGKVSPCVALLHSYTCYVLGREKRIRRYTVGDVGAEDVGDIWEAAEYRRFRARVQAFDFSPCVHCGGCHLAEGNEEDCYGNTFPVCGDCLWARGAIQCP